MYKFYEELYHYSLKEFPKEACAFIKYDGVQYSFYPVKNIHDEPNSNFLIQNIDILKHLDSSIAFFHSHPNKNIGFSESDIMTSEEFNIPLLTINIPNGEIYNYFPKAWKGSWQGLEYCYGFYDCSQLAYDYYKHELGIDLDYTIIRPHPEKWMNDSYTSPFEKAWRELDFIKVNDLQKHDLVLMQVQSKCQNHIGIYIGDNKILHQKAGKASSIDLYNEAWQKRTTGIMRYAKS